VLYFPLCWPVVDRWYRATILLWELNTSQPEPIARAEEYFGQRRIEADPAGVAYYR
jgi:hypothetical protein